MGKEYIYLKMEVNMMVFWVENKRHGKGMQYFKMVMFTMEIDKRYYARYWGLIISKWRNI